MFAETLKVMISNEADYNQMLSDNNEYQHEQMSKLEQHIYNYVIDKIPSMVEALKKQEFKTELVKYPIIIDGSIDSVIFDARTLKPLCIEYNYGIGEGVTDGLFNYFDDFELRRIYL